MSSGLQRFLIAVLAFDILVGVVVFTNVNLPTPSIPFRNNTSQPAEIAAHGKETLCSDYEKLATPEIEVGAWFIPSCVIIPKGWTIVVRKVDFIAKTADFYATSLENSLYMPEYFGEEVQKAAWAGLKTLEEASFAACESARSAKMDSSSQSSIYFQVTITLNGGPVPESCSQSEVGRVAIGHPTPHLEISLPYCSSA